MSILMNNFNALKGKGMTDSAAMAEAQRLTAESQAKQKAADAAKRKKPGRLEKLVMGATKHIKEKYHSPAGKAHIKKEKTGGGRGY